ncbi:MBL fold metallo-hydrolase [Venenivibrio stagnispumantis]|uniref:Metallo-beta-lactamase family protein n=1 Tax=Venenivibrio stagnispumantis TaxID=407998 RepID=A0AA45WM10_9AQUI|nr:MBL fold metallo-hydrolase [Venenivibrio stagnispumantis]MCW4572865.1 MBL fold metallo-hydrolase [Venenivibrio stagnispumantis]SMP13076.1 metallo-beta-lactamase family protein [Venenivibrio stagnispumantis]
MSIKVRSFGGVEGVTGSAHLLTIDNINILIDCGMFQGLEEDENYQPFGFIPASVDYLILTHSHIDHIGRIPLLVKQGFKGKIITTKPTYHLSRIMLLDAANVMAEEYKVQYKKALRRGKPEEAKKPLYDEDDVFLAMEFFKILLEYEEPYYITDNIRITFKDAAHILGSAFVEIKIKDKIIVFSGDLGTKEKLLLNSITYQDKADVVFIESTYGNRKHKSLQESIEEFKNAIIESFKDGGNIVIPTFALERAQEILYLLKMMYEKGELPPCKVFLDSPLAIAATKIFLTFKKYLKKELQNKEDLFNFPYLHFTQSVEESRKINDIESGAIILAGSGMCNGGRVKHHLKHNLWRKESSVIFVGYQAKGTLGRQIVDGAKYVKIYGEEIAVNAKIYTINGFSSHADQPTLLEWLSNIKGLEAVNIIHGEKEVMEAFKEKIKEELKLNPHIVLKKETVYII